jgi:hypothetical protein
LLSAMTTPEPLARYIRRGLQAFNDISRLTPNHFSAWMSVVRNEQTGRSDCLILPNPLAGDERYTGEPGHRVRQPGCSFRITAAAPLA